MVGVNYGQNRMVLGANELAGGLQVAKQESGVFDLTYNMNAFTQFVAEYTYSQTRWFDGAHQHSNQIALGTMFYW
jgi:hypothetical protein